MKASEVWLVNFSPQVGQEIAKVRPAVIVSPDDFGELDLKIVVPITNASRERKHWHVELQPTSTNKLTKASVVDCFQLKSLSYDRFVRKIGTLSPIEMAKVKATLAKVLDLI